MNNVKKYLRLLKSYKALKNIHIRDVFDKSNFFIFHHIPKCAGTSFAAVFRTWFIVLEDYSPARQQSPWAKCFFNRAFALAGHFSREGYYLKDRYPFLLNDSRTRIITFLREPLSLKISLYYYERSILPKEHVVHRTSLEEHLFKRTNYLSNRFPVTLDNYKKILDKYYFIGIVEEYENSVKKLANAINKPYVKVPHLNRTPKKYPHQLSHDIINRFRDENKLDYLVYEYAKERLNNI